MNATLSRRAFSAGLTLGVPAVLLGKAAASQSLHDPNGTGLDLQSALLRVSPYYLRDVLVSTPLADGSTPRRWEDIGTSPYFTSVGGVNVLRANSESILGAFSIYLAAAGTRAGSYLGKRALEGSTSEVVQRDVMGYAAEVLVYEDGGDHALAHVPIGNVMILGYDIDETGAATADTDQAAANAGVLVEHLHQVFAVTR